MLFPFSMFNSYSMFRPLSEYTPCFKQVAQAPIFRGPSFGPIFDWNIFSPNHLPINLPSEATSECKHGATEVVSGRVQIQEQKGPEGQR